MPDLAKTTRRALIQRLNIIAHEGGDLELELTPDQAAALANELEPTGVRIPGPKIPDAFITFARECAALAEKAGLREFTIELRPDWHEPDQRELYQVHGKLRIHYAAKDGRGRPCVNLNITLEGHTTVHIEKNPESSN